MIEYSKEQIAEIVDSYQLSQEEYENVIRTVIAVMSEDKIISNNPLAIVVGGQSGAGKTALINYTSAISSRREFVVIDNDYFRGFHPKASQIRRNHPPLFTQCTDQIGMGITSDIVSFFMGNDVVLPSGNIIENRNHVKYDLIFHQTLKNNRIADDAMEKLKSAGYTVGVRAFGVPYIESKFSQIERCLDQYQRFGSCRFVRPKDHITALQGVPNTVDYIQQNGKADFIEIFKRTNDIRCPGFVYSWINPENEEKTLQTLDNCENVSKETNEFGFSTAKNAILKTWDDETKKVFKAFDNRMGEILNNGAEMVPGMQEHIDELLEYKLNYSINQSFLYPEIEQ